MDIHLTSDQELFRSSTRKFLEREATTAQIRRLAETEFGFRREYWKVASELGWTSLLVPQSMDGGSISGNPLADLAILAEEGGHFAAPGPLAVTNTVIAGLTDHVGPTAHAGAIGEIMSGAAIATWAIYEPGKGWDPFNPAMTATRHDGGFWLNGIKDRVEAGDQADMFLVGARIDGELSQFLVRADTPGIRVERMWSLDFTRHYATVIFDNVAVAREALVGEIGKARSTIERQCQTMFVLQCAETAGATERVFNMALEWAIARYSFGRTLASYQAIKHRFANMKTWLEAIHAITGGAVRSIQDQPDIASRISRAANIFVSRKAVEIMQDCVQIHGGIGVTWEHDLHIYLRRATVNRALYGTPEEQRSALATLLAS